MFLYLLFMLETQKDTMGVLSCTIYTSNIFSISSLTPNKLIVKHILLLHKIQIQHFVPIDEESQSMVITVKKLL